MTAKVSEERAYMTVGQLAKRMGTTVRTLQFYDLEGLLPPSDETYGGRRLYGDRDVIRLHQIQSLKYLGFSLDEIRHHLVALDTPADVAAALAQQASGLRTQITALSKVLSDIERLIVLMKWCRVERMFDIVGAGRASRVLGDPGITLRDAGPSDLKQQLAGVQPYLAEALEAYFARQGTNPFEGVDA